MRTTLCYDILWRTKLDVDRLEASLDDSLNHWVWLWHHLSLLLLLLLLLLSIGRRGGAVAMHRLAWSVRVHLRHGGGVELEGVGDVEDGDELYCLNQAPNYASNAWHVAGT